jgi:hypothetical protein
MRAADRDSRWAPGVLSSVLSPCAELVQIGDGWRQIGAAGTVPGCCLIRD